MFVADLLKVFGATPYHNFIVTAKPSIDLSFTCKQNSQLIMKSANLPEHSKMSRVEKSLEHLDHVYRVFYITATSSWEAFTNGRCSSSDLQKYNRATTMLNSYIILLMHSKLDLNILKLPENVISLVIAVSLAPTR